MKTQRLLITGFWILGVCLLATPCLQAQVENKESNLEVRAYDISDLTRQWRNYPLDPDILPTGADLPVGPLPGAGEGGGFGGGGGTPPPPVSETDQLMSLIRELTGSWEGGPSMHVFHSSLIVRQQPGIHEKVAAVLNEIRRTSQAGVVVSVDLYWVQLSPEQFKALAGKDGNVVGIALPDDALPDATIVARGRTTGFNGQTVSLTAGTLHSVITESVPVVGTGARGYHLKSRPMLDGNAAQITAQMVEGSEHVTLDVWGVLSVVPEGAKMPLKGAVSGATGNKGAGSNSETSRITADTGGGGGQIALSEKQPNDPGEDARILGLPDVNFHEVRTTLKAPLGKKVLVGGLTSDQTDSPATYLVVEANIAQ